LCTVRGDRYLSNMVIYYGTSVRDRGKMLCLTDMWQAAQDKHVRSGRARTDFKAKRPATRLVLRTQAGVRTRSAISLVAGHRC
jgi:hypothetical protein